MQIVVVGLGKMGMGIAERLHAGGHEVFGVDPNTANTAALETMGGHALASAADIASLEGRKIVWLMIPSGDPVEQAVFGPAGLSGMLKAEDIIIDGGNSRYTDSVRRAATLAEHGIVLLDVGTSGGLSGRMEGYCLMVGGPEAAYHDCESIWAAVGQPGGFLRAGASGAGHYVKMVHNAIEYGMMQSLSEGLALIRDGQYPETDLAALTDVWQHGGIIQSNLTGLAQRVFATNPGLEGIDGFVADNGEARWTIEAAQEKGIAVPSVELAVAVRAASREGKTSTTTKILAALRNQFGGHSINK